MSRVLVTGGAGFIGQHLCRRFSEHGDTVLAVDRDNVALASASREAHGKFQVVPLELAGSGLADCLRAFTPDVVVHAAGPASVPGSVADPLADFDGCTRITALLLETIRRVVPSCRFAFLSSGAVYGNAAAAVAEDAPLAPLSPYAWHKRLGELLCEEYRMLYGIDARVFRIFSAYGNGQRKLVIHDLARQLLDPACRRIEVLGSGDEARDFIDARDLAAAIVHCLEHPAPACLNLGFGRATPIRDIVGALTAICGGSHEIIFTGSTRAGDPPRMCADITRLRATGFAPAIGLDRGLRDYCDWLRGEPPGNARC